MNPFQWKYLPSVSSTAVDAVLESWDERPGGSALFVLLCEQQSDAVSELQRCATARGVSLVGAVVPGLIVEGLLQRTGALLFAIDDTTRRMIVPLPRSGASTDEEAVQTLAAFAEDQAASNGGDTLFLLIDAMTPDVASLLDRIYLELGDLVGYAGSSVGSETFQSVPCVFDNEAFLADAVLAILLPQHPGAILTHHYRGSKSLRVATATLGNRIKTIDGIPAFNVYRELMASEYGITLERDSFYRYAVHFPFAMNRAQGEPLVRIPVATDDEGAVYCVGEVPENALLSVVRAIETGDLTTAHEIGDKVRAMNVPGVLGFYCAGRLMHLGDAAATLELQALSASLAPGPLVGALSLGEIGCVGQQKYPAFHNATMVAIPWF